jgi:hypothetical protein
VAQRLQAAGATDLVFTEDALKRVHVFSKGIPRLINLVCEHALISAYVEQIKPIPARIIDTVSEELALDERPFLISSISSADSIDAKSPHELTRFLEPLSVEDGLQEGN